MADFDWTSSPPHGGDPSIEGVDKAMVGNRKEEEEGEEGDSSSSSRSQRSIISSSDSSDEVSLLVVDEEELANAMREAGISIKVRSKLCFFSLPAFVFVT